MLEDETYARQGIETIHAFAIPARSSDETYARQGIETLFYFLRGSNLPPMMRLMPDRALPLVPDPIKMISQPLQKLFRFNLAEPALSQFAEAVTALRRRVID